VFDSRQGQDFFRHRVQTGSGATQPPIQWVTAILTAGVKQPRREADQSLPSSAEVKTVELYLHSPIRIHGDVLC
jgi:hypothetical protein